MNYLPELSAELPSRAISMMTSFFLKQLESSRLNCYGDPMYDFAKALGDVRDQKSDWVRNKAHETFQAALKEYNRLHPKVFVQKVTDESGTRLLTDTTSIKIGLDGLTGTSYGTVPIRKGF